MKFLVIDLSLCNIGYHRSSSRDCRLMIILLKHIRDSRDIFWYLRIFYNLDSHISKLHRRAEMIDIIF